MELLRRLAGARDRALLDLVRELLVARVELGAHELQRLLAELVVGELVEHGVDRRLGAAAEQQLRHHAARADRAGADLLAQRRLGLRALLREQRGGALGERPRRRRAAAARASRAMPLAPRSASPSSAIRRTTDVGVAEPRRQRRLHGLVALADRREHGRRRRAQLDPVRVEQIDDRSTEVLPHRREDDHRASGVVKPDEPAHRPTAIATPGTSTGRGRRTSNTAPTSQDRDAQAGEHRGAAICS